MIGIVLIAVFSIFFLRLFLADREEEGKIKKVRRNRSAKSARLLSCMVSTCAFGVARVSWQGWANYTTSLINAVQIQIMSFVYKKLAKTLTDFGAL